MKNFFKYEHVVTIEIKSSESIDDMGSVADRVGLWVDANITGELIVMGTPSISIGRFLSGKGQVEHTDLERKMVLIFENIEDAVLFKLVWGGKNFGH